jgi:hypothetical protein
MAQNAVTENGFVFLSPCPPQAGFWCSRQERRPHVRLIVLGYEPHRASEPRPRIPKWPSENYSCVIEFSLDLNVPM